MPACLMRAHGQILTESVTNEEDFNLLFYSIRCIEVLLRTAFKLAPEKHFHNRSTCTSTKEGESGRHLNNKTL